jgi:hypothetical protein
MLQNTTFIINHGRGNDFIVAGARYMYVTVAICALNNSFIGTFIYWDISNIIITFNEISI